MRPYGSRKRKSHGPVRSPMAPIPSSGLDLWVALSKVKIKEEKVKHFCILQILLYNINK